MNRNWLDKLYNLEIQVDLLKNEIEYLKKQIEKEWDGDIPYDNGDQPNVENKLVREGKSQSINAIQAEEKSQVMDKPQLLKQSQMKDKPPVTASTHQETIPEPSRYVRKQEQDKIGIENRIGKYFMGVLASLLIFISLILFVSLIYQYLTDTMKLFGVYFVSTAILAVGLWICRRKKNAFTMSLLGCGMGAYYLSFLMTRLYFQRIDDYTLFVLIGLWLSCVYLLSRRYPSPMFTIIGQMGILIAVLFGVMGVDSDTKLNFLTLYFIITTMGFWYLQEKRTEKYILVTMVILNILAAFGLSFGILSYESDLFGRSRDTIHWEIMASSVFLFLYLVHLFYIGLSKFKNKLTDTGQTVMGLVLLFTVYLNGFLITANLFPRIQTSNRHIVLFIILILLWVMVECLSICKWNRMLTVLFCNAYMLVHFFMIIQNNDFWMGVTKTFGFLFWYVPVLALGWLKEDKRFYNGIGLFLIVCNALLLGNGEGVLLLCGTLPLIGVVLFLYGVYLKREETYSIGNKIAGYLILLFNAYLLLYKLMEQVSLSGMDVGLWTRFAGFLLIACINIGMLVFGFDRDWSLGRKDDNGWTREIKTHMVLRLVNTILWVGGMNLMYEMEPNIGVHVLLIAVTAILCSVGVKEAMDQWRKENWLGFYLGIKFTLYLIVVLRSFQTDNGFLVSLLCIAIAVVCILVGFRFKIQSFRLYGLLLTMVSTGKLVLLDIRYDNSVGRVVSFLLCGILCFGINMIYQRVSRKMEEPE